MLNIEQHALIQRPPAPAARSIKRPKGGHVAQRAVRNRNPVQVAAVLGHHCRNEVGMPDRVEVIAPIEGANRRESGRGHGEAGGADHNVMHHAGAGEVADARGKKRIVVPGAFRMLGREHGRVGINGDFGWAGHDQSVAIGRKAPDARGPLLGITCAQREHLHGQLAAGPGADQHQSAGHEAHRQREFALGEHATKSSVRVAEISLGRHIVCHRAHSGSARLGAPPNEGGTAAKRDPLGGRRLQCLTPQRRGLHANEIPKAMFCHADLARLAAARHRRRFAKRGAVGAGEIADVAEPDGERH